MYQGKPHRWGTQLKRIDGKMRLWPVDPATTDGDRAKWGVPALAQQKAREAEFDKE
jgi:hypothetical protein